MSIVQPGPELDVRIAELIGYHSMTTAMNLDGTFGYIPAFSTTWQGMQLVVEEMQRRGFEYRFGSYATVSFTWKHWAKFNDDTKLYETITADSLPHAVCMAALSALEGQADG